jgi:hypothetical protein
MDLSSSDLGSPSRLRLLLDHFSLIKDAREPHRVAFPMGGAFAGGGVRDDRRLRL